MVVLVLCVESVDEPRYFNGLYRNASTRTGQVKTVADWQDAIWFAEGSELSLIIRRLNMRFAKTIIIEKKHV